MILRQNSDRPMYWGAAFSLSAVAHILVFISVFDLWPNGKIPQMPPLTIPEITVSTVMVSEPENAPATVAAPSEVMETEPGAAGPTPAAPEPEVESPPEPEAATAPEPERIQPVNPVEMTLLSPVRPDENTTLLGTAPVTVTPERLRAEPLKPQNALTVAPVVLAPLNTIAGSGQAALPAAPAKPAPPEDPVMQQLIEDIRNRLGDPCLVAIPQRDNAGDPVVVVIADNDRTINAFADAVLNREAAQFAHRPVLVDSRQCPVLDMVRENRNYPLFGLSLNLRSQIVANGGILTGSIERIAGSYTSLLLVDDNGVVQDLRRFTSFIAGRAEFDVPVTRPGAARDTSQILLAITTPNRPGTISARAGHLAADFFADLKKEQGGNINLALSPFQVR